MLEDDTLLGPAELAKLLGRSSTMVALDARRKPDTLPPRFVIPGKRALKWRVKDVRDWMQMLADREVERRKAAYEFQAAQGIADKKPTRMTFYLKDRVAEAERRKK